MITYVACDLFLSPARVLVNTVNTVGVMGKGIAKSFKQVYPDMFERYQELCERDAFDIGELWLYRTTNKWVLNFPTKRHWRQQSRPEYVEQGLKKFVDTHHVLGITSVSFPLLGCGNGELDWETQVRPLMEKYLNPLPISVFVHLQPVDDRFVPERRDSKTIKEWLRGEPGSLAFGEVWHDLKALLAAELRFDTYDGRESFDVEVGEIEGEEGLIIRPRSGTEFIPHEAVLELWQHLRQTGFVAGDWLPYGLDTRADYILPVMAKLPYVEPVVMAHSYSDIGGDAIGMRLALRPRESQPSLFEAVGVVEPE